MAFETGTATDYRDLLEKLETFLTSESPTPWVIEQSMSVESPFHLAVSDGDECHVQFHERSSSEFYIIGSESWDGSTPGENPGTLHTTLTNSCKVNRAAGPYENYWFYSNFDPAAGPVYCHAVIEVESNVFRHFGFGNLQKVGVWAGGSYHYGHKWDQGSNSDSLTSVGSSGHQVPWDCRTTTSVQFDWGMRFRPGESQGWNGVVESPQQAWGVVRTSGGGIVDNDGRRTEVMQGDNRNSFYDVFRMAGPGSQFNGFLPLSPIPVLIGDVDPNPDEWYLMGYAPDTRIVHMQNLAPGQSLTIGGDTWDCYPLGVARENVGDNLETTEWMGLAYKRLI